MTKWDREHNSKMDNQQLVFNNGELTQKIQKQEPIFTFKQRALCPFCFQPNDTDKFVISTKKGYHKRLGKCPNCQNQAEWKTFFANWTIKTFAQFCYEYSCSGFWQKCKYQQFNDALRQIGWLDQFWTEYKNLKGDSTDKTESYQDYMERKQVEEAKEQGWI